MAKRMMVTVYACPTEDCGNYVGMSSFDGTDLAKVFNVKSSMSHNVGDVPGERIGSRAECPDCKRRQIKVERVPVTVEIEVPQPVAA